MKNIQSKMFISLRVKSAIFASFLLLSLGGTLIYVASNCLKTIIDKHKYLSYKTKTQAIIKIIDIRYNQKKDSSEDWQKGLIKELKELYYKDKDLLGYPVIVDSTGAVTMHRVLAYGDKSLIEYKAFLKFLACGSGDGYYTYKGEKKWVVFIRDDNLDWIVFYTVPIKEKYAALYSFRHKFIVSGICIIIVLFLASIIFIRITTRPILSLIKAATKVPNDHQTELNLIHTADEVGILSKTFEEMNRAIHKQFAVIRAKEAHIRALIDTLPNIIWLKGVDGVYLSCNKKFENFFGAKESEIVGKTDYDFVDKELADSFRKNDLIALNANEATVNEEEVTYANDGHTEKLETIKMPMYDSVGELIGILGIGHDITSRLQKEKELQNLRNYLINIIDSMPSILIGVDEDGLITQWNKYAEQGENLSFEEVKGKKYYEVCPRLEGEKENLKKALKTGKQQVTNNKKYIIEDELFYEDITIYPLIANGVEGAVMRIDDVTKRHQLETRLVQRSKMDTIGQLAGGVAHDFNNMLGGIMGAAQLLQSSATPLDEENSQFVDLIIQASTRAAGLTTKLLAFARKGKLVSENISVHKIINDTIAILEKTIDRKIVMSTSQKADDYTIIGDINALQNSFMNLGINASHAMPSGGKISFETCNVDLDMVYCEASNFDIKPGKYVEVSVRDNGVGISQAVKEKIFEPFFTTKDSSLGTGLGLASVYGTMQEHSGAIAVYSELGTGTVFHLYLPISNSPITKKRERSIMPSGSGTILLVDDEEILLTTGKGMLEFMGYQVFTFTNGLDAIEYFKREEVKVDLVISDMVMPNINGKEVFYKLREIDENCKVIIYSGFTKDEDISELQRNGLAGFLKKPFQLNDLSTLVADVLHY